jgi:hypothetical protein
MVTILVLLDQTKAFDVVDHRLLLAKLKYIGFDATSVKWFSSYLINRSQCVKIKNNCSVLSAVPSGVPQGSILGPILFTVYTSDLPGCIKHCQLHMYADDVQLYYSSYLSDIHLAINKVNSDLLNLSVWCEQNGLKLNPSKSKVLCIGSHQLHRYVNLTNMQVTLNGNAIDWVSSAKNLGVFLDDHLLFNTHVDEVFKRCFIILKGLHKFKYELSRDTKFKMVKSLIYPIMDYCLLVYYPHLTELYKYKLQKI